MWRRLRQLLTLLCLILAVATAELWVRSGWRGDNVRHERYIANAADGSAGSVRQCGVASQEGRIQLWAFRGDFSGYPPGYFSGLPRYNGWYFDSGPREVWPVGLLGFGVVSGAGNLSAPGRLSEIVPFTRTAVQFPHWLLVLLLSLPPAIAAVRWWRRRRVRRAMGVDAVPCPACGYDCRATPGRCPECGTPAEAP